MAMDGFMLMMLFLTILESNNQVIFRYCDEKGSIGECK